MTLIVLFLFGLYPYTNVRSLFQRLVLLLGELIDCFSEALKHSARIGRIRESKHHG